MLRRILRRAVTFARKLGVRELVLVTIAETVIENMREAYPDLERNREFILKVIEQEEARFHDTLDAGMSHLDTIVADGSDGSVIEAGDVFRLVRHFRISARANRRGSGGPRFCRWIWRGSSGRWRRRG